VLNVGRTIREMERAGVAGVHIVVARTDADVISI
jgi:2-methylisocitrate lyase-like PEP mutase family enzyme